MKLTKEQEKVVNCDLLPGEILKVIAFAGTGKTTTLVEYTKIRPHQRFLYVAFNKSVQLEATRKFPPNVICRTSHALAFPKFGSLYKDRIVPGIKANVVMKALQLDSYEDAQFTIDTLLNFLSSSDDYLSQNHVSIIARKYYERKKLKTPVFVDLANQLMELMIEGTDPTIGMLHDGYLKLYQLSNPHINYNCILLDEAQDINPVTAAFLLSQTHSSIVLVGDPHQQIYSFRGARNTMNVVNSDYTEYLTLSFRFTQEIADYANLILEQFKEEEQDVIGLKLPDDEESPKVTIIARTNAKVFDEAVFYNEEKKKVGFVGGFHGYRFYRILDTYYLYSSKKDKVRDAYIRSFDSFKDMEFYGKTVMDFELMSICKVVTKYKKKIPKLIQTIEEKAVDPVDADVILTTAHKSKGLEWPKVELADDFPPLVREGKIIKNSDLEPDEFNLIYVSITRAMNLLKIAPKNSMNEFIDIYFKSLDESELPIATQKKTTLSHNHIERKH